MLGAGREDALGGREVVWVLGAGREDALGGRDVTWVLGKGGKVAWVL